MRILAILTLSLLSFSCAQKTAAPDNAPQATVQLKDGTSVAGAVIASSPAEVTIQAADNSRRTIPMRDVRAIEYADAAPVTAPAAAGTPGYAPTQSDLIHQRHTHPTEARVTSKTLEVPAGTPISVRVEETIDSSRAAEGQTYAAEVTKDVVDAAGDIVIPSNANAKIVIRSSSRGGRFKGTSDLVLDLDSVSVDGRMYHVETTDLVRNGREGVGANKRTATFTGGGAALGAIIGAIAGGGKGAAIGAAAGAGAGAGTQILTKGQSIKIPVESVLTFKLEAPLRIAAQRY